MTGGKDHRGVREEKRGKETVTDSKGEKPMLVSCASTADVMK